ncbi:MAG TPA: hypothetical protein VJX67_26515, partial [Blastocatellia bacterium]|nr:hypothetical protein [Blastocatellia bacterium]
VSHPRSPETAVGCPYATREGGTLNSRVSYLNTFPGAWQSMSQVDRLREYLRPELAAANSLPGRQSFRMLKVSMASMVSPPGAAPS